MTKGGGAEGGRRASAATRDAALALGLAACWTLGVGWLQVGGAWSPAWPVAAWLCGLALVVAVAGMRAWPGVAFWTVVLGYPLAYRTGLQSELHLAPVLLATFAATRAGVLGPVAALLSAGAGTALLTVQGGLVPVSGPALVLLGWRPVSRPSEVVALLALTCAAVAVGTLVHRLERTTTELTAGNAQLRRLAAVRAERAVLEERTRIARELHDVVAHHVSAIVVRAQAATRVAETDPAAPLDATRWIAGAGKDALAAMRSVVSVLRADGSPAGPGAALTDPPTLLAPVVRLGEVDEAAARLRDAGVDVQVEIGEAVARCPDAVVLAAVRITQEALTNVLLHSAATRATVRLTADAASLRVTVEDPGPRCTSAQGNGGPADLRDSGHGLVHMAEHARTCGGTVLAGSQGDGWAVRVVLPSAAGGAATSADVAREGRPR